MKKDISQLLREMKELEDNCKDFSDCWITLKQNLWQEEFAAQSDATSDLCPHGRHYSELCEPCDRK